MPLFKNLAGQKVPVYAYDSNGAKTGDAANITGSISKDGAAPAAIADTNPTEVGGGWYAFDITQAESNANLLLWYGASGTSGVKVEGGSGFTVEQLGGVPVADCVSIGGEQVDQWPTLEGSLPMGETTGTPTTTVIPLTGEEVSGDQNYAGRYLWLLNGALQGWVREIQSYNTGTKTATCVAFPAAPAAGVKVRILPEKPV